MQDNGNKSGTRFSFKGALEAAKKAPPGGKGTFLHLTDGQAVDVVPVGDVLKIQGVWVDKRFKPYRNEHASKGLRPTERYALVAILLDEHRAVVVETNGLTLKEWAEDLDGAEDVVVRLKRLGGPGDPKARITARAVRPLKASESDELDAVVLPNLEEIYSDFLEEKAA